MGVVSFQPLGVRLVGITPGREKASERGTEVSVMVLVMLVQA